MPQLTINLSEHANAYLRKAVEGGQYPDVNAAMEDALDLLQAETSFDEQKLKQLQQIAVEGFEGARGPNAIVLNTPEDLRAFMDGILNEVLAEEEHDASTAA